MIELTADAFIAAEQGDRYAAQHDLAHLAALEVTRQGDHVPRIANGLGKAHQSSSSPFHSISKVVAAFVEIPCLIPVRKKLAASIIAPTMGARSPGREMAS